ncbi:cytochrome P450 [Phanerochaete sordida]|uniref:Cytochrome P450 n=1 Tax=Phanerochaete sordida TaxID=48140 RepID=A0A9P3GDE9_9APHY|nr:cytochrome P450 [Phanerochaete sordida]
MLTVIIALVAVFAASRVLKFYRAKRELGNLPGLRSLVTPMSPLGVLLPPGRFNPGRDWQWRFRNTVYRDAGTETITTLPYLFGPPCVYTSSPEVARQVVSTKGQFFKELGTVLITLLWGPNIFAANGDEWKRHRRIINQAFNNETFASVWSQTARVFDEMEEGEGWTNKSIVEVPVVNGLTNKLALILISTCGFGNPLKWQFSEASSDGMSFEQAMTIVIAHHIALMVIPQWVYRLPIKWVNDLESAVDRMNAFMRQLIEKRRMEMARGEPEKTDILSAMIKSSESDGKFTMEDSELVGNTFLLLSAGHDTVAHTLDATLAFLALHQDFQREVLNELEEVMPTEAEFTYENSSRLVKLRAAFLEASRIFPSGVMMIRDATEDLVLQNVGPSGDEVLPLKRGSRVVVDMVGLHHNPRIFPEPEAFKPERWYKTHENDLSMFSFGARACIGRKFAITEGVCFLARLLRRWKVEMLTKPGETKAEWERRVVRGVVVLNLGIGDVPIRMIRR